MATPLIALPRGPVIFNQKSASLDYPDTYKAGLRRWRDATREDAIRTRRANPEFEEIKNYINLLTGSHWNPNRPRYRSSFYDNRLADSRTDRLATLTDIRPTIDVRAHDRTYTQQAEVIEEIIHAEWARLNLDIELVRVVDHAQFGVGYWKIGAYTPGFMTIASAGMDTVLPIQPAMELQESAGVLYRTYKNLGYFRGIWGDKANGLERESVKNYWSGSTNDYARPTGIAEYQWNALSPQMRYALGGRAIQRVPTDGSPFPVIELEEYWIDDQEINDSSHEVLVQDPGMSLDQHNYWYRVAPGQRLFPRKRLIVFGGERDMSDGPSPYWHGLYPFAQLCLDPIVWGPGGLSVYRNQVPIVKAINEVVAGILDLVKRAVNQQVVTRENAVSKATWEKFFPDLPGGKLRVSPVASPSDVRYIEPPQLPAYVIQMLLSYLLPTHDRRAGRLDIGRLLGKKQIPGSDTIEGMREVMGSPFRLESRFIEVFLEDVGEQAISNAIQFFGRRRREAILGPRGDVREDFDLKPDAMAPWAMQQETHWKNFAFKVERGSLHGASKDRDRITAITLAKMRMISRAKLLRVLEIHDADKIEQELAEEQKQMLDAMQASGRTPRLSRGQRNGSPI